MNKHIQDYYDKAQSNYQRLQNEVKREGKLTVPLTEYVYNLQRIKIAVAYRLAKEELSNDEKEAIQEICGMYDSAINLKEELTNKSVY